MTITDWITQLPHEIDQVEKIIEPKDERYPGSVSYGFCSDYAKKVYTLWRILAKATAQLSLDMESREETEADYRELHLLSFKRDIVKQFLFLQVFLENPQVKIPCAVIKGFEVVSMPEMPHFPTISFGIGNVK